MDDRIYDEILNKDGAAADFLRKVLGDKERCASCGLEHKDLRRWPPDATIGPRWCGGCRLKKAVEAK